MNALKMNALKRFYYRHKKITDFKPHVKKSKRSFWGNVILGLFLIALASLFFLPSTLHDQSVIKADERDVHLST